jgi:hypothetical protein
MFAVSTAIGVVASLPPNMRNKPLKKLILTVILPLFVTWSSICVSDTCYTVEGEVKTINISETTQIGSIDILLLDEYDNEAFRETGGLIGNITGGDFFTTYLSHSAQFGDGSTFVTSDDKAAVTGIRKQAENGTYCSFFIHEEITNIVQGSGFFANVNSAAIHADGYISACIADGENENEFELSGELCVD